IGKLDKACDRLANLMKISVDPSNRASAANLARHCGQYDVALNIFKNIYQVAPHFSLWFKKDYAWTYLMTAFEKTSYDTTDAKLYLESQLAANYSEPGINEMWLAMLAYLYYRDGKSDKARRQIELQAKLENPIDVLWKNQYPNILNENSDFKDDFFKSLQVLGLVL
ncbi:MAG: hypothetical protein CML40_08430, partial [Rhodobacteraceae bacterium]